MKIERFILWLIVIANLCLGIYNTLSFLEQETTIGIMLKTQGLFLEILNMVSQSNVWLSI